VRTLLVLLSLFAIAILLITSVFNSITHGNYDDIARKLNRSTAIYDVRITVIEQGIVGLAKDVETISFRIVGRPESHIKIISPNQTIFGEADHMYLAEIGDFSLFVDYRDAQRSLIGSGFPDVSSNGNLRRLLPFTISNLNQLISRYDDLINYFKTWPVYPKVQSVKISTSETLDCYRVNL
jgi:hypothetical protein